MELIQIFLPLRDNSGNPFPVSHLQTVKEQLLEEFGGVTAFLRSPGEGIWEESPENFMRDDVVTFEVMTEQINLGWWKSVIASERKHLASRIQFAHTENDRKRRLRRVFSNGIASQKSYWRSTVKS